MSIFYFIFCSTIYFQYTRFANGQFLLIRPQTQKNLNIIIKTLFYCSYFSSFMQICVVIFLKKRQPFKHNAQQKLWKIIYCLKYFEKSDVQDGDATSNKFSLNGFRIVKLDVRSISVSILIISLFFNCCIAFFA